MGLMRILDSTGDSRVTWDVGDDESVRRARATFCRLAGEKKIPFARPMGAPAEEAERIWTFDPGLEEIIWVRPIAGG